MIATNITDDIWHWHHNISEAYYHIQLTIKYRKPLFNERTEQVIIEITKGFKERYAIEITHIGFDKNHVHLLCRFLPKYSGGQVIRLIKMITAKQIFRVKQFNYATEPPLALQLILQQKHELNFENY